MPLPTPTLHTTRLLLRPFIEADADVLFALQSSPRVLRYWDSPPWNERARADRFIAACKQMEDEGTGARLAIERVCDRVFIGWCCLIKWNPDYRSATMGYCLDDAVWGQGFATEAAGAILQWAFDTLDLNRVQAETDTRNTASSRVLEKFGSCAKARCERTASWMARCRTRGCTGFSGGTGSRRRTWAQVTDLPGVARVPSFGPASPRAHPTAAWPRGCRWSSHRRRSRPARSACARPRRGSDLRPACRGGRDRHWTIPGSRGCRRLRPRDPAGDLAAAVVEAPYSQDRC